MLLRDRAGFPAVVGSVTEARHFVELRLTVVGCPDATVHTAALLVSELATNAVQHASAPFSVALHHDEQGLTVEVADAGEGEVLPREPDDRGGYGLRIVAALADDWGVRDQLGGKAVYFRLPC
jgi:anti-sigma regulatory factor (Ser/Thr protein kinase)